jgi:hypothetical protein
LLSDDEVRQKAKAKRRGRVMVKISTRFDHKRQIMGILEGSGVQIFEENTTTTYC